MPCDRKKTRKMQPANWEMKLLEIGLPAAVPLAPLMKAKFLWGAASLVQHTIETMI